VLAFLAGELTEAEAKERTISGTRRFARRQESWFSRLITQRPFHYGRSIPSMRSH